MACSLLATAALAVAATAAPTPIAGQDHAADLDRLRAAVAAAPDEPRPRCELAFALVRANQPREAIDAATPAIDQLRTQPGARARRTLGACLYNRGRAHEAAGETASAIADYADSLDLRPNDAVAARLTTLAPGAQSGLSAAAAIVEGFEHDPDATIARTRAADRTTWSFVPSARTEEPTVVAVARLCGAPHAAVAARAYFDNYGALTVESAEPRTLGGLHAIVLRVRGAGDATCGTTDGVIDAHHEETAVVFADGCDIRVARFVTSAFECDRRRPIGRRVRFDEDGNAIVTRRPRHDAPASELGTFRLRDLAR